jgi:flavin reductase (DIM6/NTAB) family NADH-FMN oxidoreductase RutF
MSIDARAFRHTAGQFVTGVTVIAAEVDGTIKAMTANSFTSLSLDPPLVLFCVGKTTHMGTIVHQAPRFSALSRPFTRAATTGS